MPDFVHLHNHSHYSILDAACTPEALVKAAGEHNQPAIALTDHGVMFGIVEFYRKAKAYGIKPILGCEVYLATGSRFEKIATNRKKNQRNYYHLLLLAKNEVGYKNLMKLTSLAHLEGFYYKPRIDKELLQKYSEGLVVTSGCLASEINSYLLRKDLDGAYQAAKFYKDLFGEDFYIELQNHGLPEDAIILEYAPKLAKKIGAKLVATNDCHYIRKEHAEAHNVFLHIRDASAHQPVDLRKLRYRVPEMYVKSTEEMVALFQDFPEAIETTLEIAEKCTVELKKELHFPEYRIPEGHTAKDLDEYLRALTYEGLRRRYGTITQEIQERADYELGVIQQMGYAGYFLVVQDFINAAREMGIRVGPGRGSAAGSLVSYAIGITDIDPLEYNLLFERFLNPERVSLPDIDVDFNDEKRDRVIEYVREKYGNDAVAQIITFGTLSARAVLKDVGRVLGIPHATINAITKHIPVVLGKVTPLREALQLPELRWLTETEDEKMRKLVEYSLLLEGLCRNVSLHAAGVVIAPGNLMEYVPVYKSPQSEVATQYNMKDLEEIGLLKMDFLGLRTLSIIDRTLELIEQNYGERIDIDNVDLNDPETYKLLGEGKTIAIFQFEAPLMQQSLRELKPSSIYDLIALNALNRPGPMANIPEYIARKHGRSPITYLHPVMEKSLKETYGIIIYQEQVMQLVRDIAGFSLAQADILRRAMGKKDATLMQKQRDAFLEGAVSNGFDRKLAEEIFELIERFAQYGFNKSHSAAYAYLAYQTAWLKAHYPAEFLAANMSSEINNLEKIAELVADAQHFGLRVLPPDVNESEVFFSTQGNTIRFGLAGIKNTGIAAAEAIVAEREKNGPYTSFFDFVRRLDPRVRNKRVLEALICTGAFDSLHPRSRSRLYTAIESALEYAHAYQEAVAAETNTLFGNDQMSTFVKEPALPECEPWSVLEQMQREKEFLKIVLSARPLQRFYPFIEAFHPLRSSSPQQLHNKKVRLCGILTEVVEKRDRRNHKYAFATLDDLKTRYELLFWRETYQQYATLLQENSFVVVCGTIDASNGKLRMTVEQLWELKEAVQKFVRGIHLRISQSQLSAEFIEKLRAIAAAAPGSGKLYFTIQNNGYIRQYEAQKNFIAITLETVEALVDLLGHRNVKLIIE